MLNIALLGSDSEHLHQKIKSSYLPAKVTILDKSLKGPELLKTLRENHIHLVLLSGYKQRITKDVLQYYPRRILNLHHSALPKFGGEGMYGLHVHNAVLAANEKITGATIHLVNSEEYDKGPIIVQQTIPIEQNDNAETLYNKVLKNGNEMFIKVLREFILGRLNLDAIT